MLNFNSKVFNVYIMIIWLNAMLFEYSKYFLSDTVWEYFLIFVPLQIFRQEKSTGFDSGMCHRMQIPS